MHRTALLRPTPAAALALAAAVAAALAPGQARAGGYCFTVVDAGGRVVRQTTDAPIDLSRPLANGLSAAGYAPGTHLMFNQDAENCPRIDTPVARPGARATTRPPMRGGRRPQR